MDQRTLAERIVATREERGLTVTDLADACGVSVSAVLYWESVATKNLKNDNLFALADKLGVNARWLAIGQGPKRAGAAIKAATVLLALGGFLIPSPPTQAADLSTITAPVYYVKLLWRQIVAFISDSCRIANLGFS